jgi:hypothetical protein
MEISPRIVEIILNAFDHTLYPITLHLHTQHGYYKDQSVDLEPGLESLLGQPKIAIDASNNSN